jgi:hypothetical protein
MDHNTAVEIMFAELTSPDGDLERLVRVLNAMIIAGQIELIMTSDKKLGVRLITRANLQ